MAIPKLGRPLLDVIGAVPQAEWVVSGSPLHELRIAIHNAACVGALAATGELLVSGTVKDLVAGPGIRFVHRGAKRLKGISDEWRLFAAAP